VLVFKTAYIDLSFLNRATRLGEFSPTGLLFTVRSLLKIKELPEDFCSFFQDKRYVMILTKSWLGHILFDFFKNSSGHTVSEVQSEKF
jgi:hypothetical protein